MPKPKPARAKWKICSGESITPLMAIVPAERNFLLNPAHPDFRRLRAGKPVRFVFDSRLLGR